MNDNGHSVNLKWERCLLFAINTKVTQMQTSTSNNSNLSCHQLHAGTRFHLLEFWIFAIQSVMDANRLIYEIHSSPTDCLSTVCWIFSTFEAWQWPKKCSIFHFSKYERILLLGPQMLQLSDDLCSTGFCSLLLFIWKKTPPSFNLIKSDSNQNMTWVWTQPHNNIHKWNSYIPFDVVNAFVRTMCLFDVFYSFPLSWSVHVNCKRKARSSDWCMMRILKMDFDMLNISCSILDYLFIKLIFEIRCLLAIWQKFPHHSMHNIFFCV